MSTNLTFKHSGRMGDIVWSLALIKQLGGAEVLYINIGSHGFNQDNYNFLRPLLVKQPYIKHVEVYTDQKVDYDLDRFRNVMNQSWHGSLCGSYFYTFNIEMDKNLQIDPWLYIDNQLNHKIVISRSTSLYHRDKHNNFWDTLIEKNLERNCVFVGHKHEHDIFNNEYKCNIDYYPVENAWELANVIGGCAMWTGNQSLPAVIAEATKRTIFLESRLDNAKNDHIFDRANLFLI